MAKFWKTTITVIVLSEGDEPNFSSLNQVAYEIEEGDCSGHWSEASTEISAQDMADELYKQGSEPGFLGIQVDENDKVTSVGYGD